MIVNQELIKMVGSNTLFKGVSKDFLKSFIRPKNYYGVKEGTIIYSKGDESTSLYLIVEGEVKLKFCDRNKVEHRFITDFFGEEELLNKSERTSFAIANHDCILYSINKNELESLSNQQQKIAENLSEKNKEESIYSAAAFEENNLSDLQSNENGNGLEANPDEILNMDNSENFGEENSETNTDTFNEDDARLN